MGRKGLFAEKPKKGPGRKAKKQGPPVLSRQFKGKCLDFISNIINHVQLFDDFRIIGFLIDLIEISAEKETKDEQLLSHRQKQRLARRTKKQEEKKIKMSGFGRNKNKKQQPKQKYNSESEEEESDSDAENEEEVEEMESDSGENENRGFTDENSEWLKPKKSVENDSDSDSMDDEEELNEEMIDEDGEVEEEEESDDDNMKVKF